MEEIVMYLVVRKSLNLSIGKCAAQCAHGAQMVQKRRDEVLREIQIANEAGFDTIDQPWLISFDKWLSTSYSKIVLGADEAQWEKLKLLTNEYVVVVDAGRTELEPGTETVIAFFPMLKSTAQTTLIKRLQVLK